MKVATLWSPSFQCKLRVNSMFEANFSSSSLDLHEDLALEELEHSK